MIIESSDGYWSTEGALIEQGAPLFGAPWSAYVSAAGRHGSHAGVMLEDRHFTVTTARDLAAALLKYADIAEAQAISEVAFSPEMAGGALS